MLELINDMLAQADLTTPEGCRRLADELIYVLGEGNIGSPILIVSTEVLVALEQSPRARILWPRRGIDEDGHIIFPVGPAGHYGPMRVFLDPHSTRIAVAVSA